MSYRLQITQFEDNPNYKDELKEYKQQRIYGYSERADKYPQALIEKRTLDVVVSDDEYQAIKKEVLKVI